MKQVLVIWLVNHQNIWLRRLLTSLIWIPFWNESIWSWKILQLKNYVACIWSIRPCTCRSKICLIIGLSWFSENLTVLRTEEISWNHKSRIMSISYGGNAIPVSEKSTRIMSELWRKSCRKCHRSRLDWMYINVRTCWCNEVKGSFKPNWLKSSKANAVLFKAKHESWPIDHCIQWLRYNLLGVQKLLRLWFRNSYGHIGGLRSTSVCHKFSLSYSCHSSSFLVYFNFFSLK